MEFQICANVSLILTQFFVLFFVLRFIFIEIEFKKNLNLGGVCVELDSSRVTIST